MESELALRLVKKLDEEYNINAIEVISDGDTKAYNTLVKNCDWYIKKWNCLNHMIKNSTSNLYITSKTATNKFSMML